MPGGGPDHGVKGEEVGVGNAVEQTAGIGEAVEGGVGCEDFGECEGASGGGPIGGDEAGVDGAEVGASCDDPPPQSPSFLFFQRALYKSSPLHPRPLRRPSARPGEAVLSLPCRRDHHLPSPSSPLLFGRRQ